MLHRCGVAAVVPRMGRCRAVGASLHGRRGPSAAKTTDLDSFGTIAFLSLERTGQYLICSDLPALWPPDDSLPVPFAICSAKTGGRAPKVDATNQGERI